MRTSKKDAIVGFKLCPKCGGLGRVPCDGMEHYRQLHRAWAEQLHLKPVVYNWQGKAAIPGLAVARLLPGGWYGVRVYVAITAIPKSGVFDAGCEGYIAYRLNEQGIVRSIMSVQGVDLSSFDIINDKAFWYLFCHSTSKDELTPLDYWPENISLDERRLLEAKHSI